MINLRKLTPRERAAIQKRIKVLDAQIQSHAASMLRIDELHQERAVLKARLAIGMVPRRQR